MHTLLKESIARINARHAADVILIEPNATDGILFMFSPASFTGRRKMLEYAYRTTRDRVTEWLATKAEPVSKAGWSSRATAVN